jgi:hypothetical protein
VFIPIVTLNASSREQLYLGPRNGFLADCLAQDTQLLVSMLSGVLQQFLVVLHSFWNFLSVFESHVSPYINQNPAILFVAKAGALTVVLLVAVQTTKLAYRFICFV